MNNLYVFGDSWAEGAELKENEKPFGYFLSVILNVFYKNHGEKGISFFDITNRLIQNLSFIDKDDFVVIIVPPDSRVSKIVKDGFFETVEFKDEYYRQIAKNNSYEYFIWYHNLLFNFCINNLRNIGCKFILATNYGNLKLMEYNKKYENFLLENSLHDLLNEKNDIFENYLPNWISWIGPNSKKFNGKYFEGCHHHPNELGHKKIAEILSKKLKSL